MTIRFTPRRPLLATLTLVAMCLSTLLVAPSTARAAEEVEISFIGWSPSGADIKSGQEKFAKFRLTNGMKKNVSVRVTTRIQASCSISAVKERNEPVIVGAGQSTEVEDTTIKGGADCKGETLKWSSEYRYEFTDKAPTATPSANTPRPSVVTATQEAPSAAPAAPTTKAPEPVQEKKSSGNLMLPILLGFLGLLILVLVGGILYMAKRERKDNDQPPMDRY